MPALLCTGAQLRCSFGSAPAVFANLPTTTPLMSGTLPAATITQLVPLLNIATFATCSAPTNPAVIAATSAALGVPTPAPCVPAIVGTWTPPSSVMKSGGLPLATVGSVCNCSWLGVITVTTPAGGNNSTI